MQTKTLVGITLFFSISCAFANLMPYGWDKEKEGIWQIAFEGQYDDQSNNLAQPTSVAAGFVPPGEEGTATLSQYSPPFGTDPDRDWGYVISLGYILPSHQYDIRANYSWLRSDKDVAETNTFALSNENGGISSENVSGAEFSFDYTDADITLGRLLKFGKKTLIRLGVGIGYADIKQNSDDAFTQSHIVNPNPNNLTCVGFSPCLTTDGSFENKFKGLGPKFTVDGQYNFNRFIAIVAGVGVSGLYGESEANMNGVLTYAQPGISPPLTVADTHLSDDTLAVGIEGRVGLDFTPYRADDVAMDVEVGYQFTSYLNALQKGDTFINQDIAGNTKPGSGAVVTVLQEFDDDYFNSGLFVNVGVSYR